MRIKYFQIVFLLTTMIFCQACHAQNKNTKLLVGAEQMESYIPMLENKNVALLINHTSYVNQTHLLDTLLALDISVKKIFAPEHGFRGNQSNGEKVVDGTDQKTGLPIISLYGKNKKPSTDQLANIDVVIFDIQDVGARFYTYISSMHYMMEACAEIGIQFIVLDRPNPNANYIDGPVLEAEHASFVGLHPIPIVYGLTEGELAKMIIGEKWINQADQLDLKIVELANWTHDSTYTLPIPPSPNLPNQQSILLYPSLCLFEGTNISIGRGTANPFQVIGFPNANFGSYKFEPKSIPNASKYPKHENKTCHGQDLRETSPPNQINLSYLIDYYNKTTDKTDYFNSFFTKLAGTAQLKIQIEQGLSETQITKSWKEGLIKYKNMRAKYLLYD